MENQIIQDLLDQALDYQDWDLLQSLFAPTVQGDYSDYGMPAQTFTREQLIGIFQHSFSRPGLRTQHQSTNFRITLAGDRATSVSNFTGHHFIPGFAGGEEFTLYAEYTDELAKTDGRWLLHGVRLKVFYTSGNLQILIS
ncbi:nuclear transport factor 2 family protein [Hymenobacter terrenus]|uniref:nuclear transport factor 2 family protein n=1 Tax=Hymenobacter terrenus TaxID=1629124 RepID=UPI000B058B73|nr:nuclear transport factor 2 family protein [Hymenobacter terrenus]